MATVKLNLSRIEAIGLELGKLGLKYILRLEELDPQFQAIKSITSRFTLGGALTLITLNSLISYRLNGRGEDYWSEFASYLSKADEPGNLKEAVKLVIDFLWSSKINVALRRTKTTRLLKLSLVNILEPKLMAKRAKNLRAFAETLASNLKAQWRSKTVLFALKMMCYARKAYYERDFIAPFDVPIPVDSRVAKISWTSGILDVEGVALSNWSDVINVVTRRTGIVQKAWSTVARSSGVPPLHMDSLLWLIGGFIGKRNSREDAVKMAFHVLINVEPSLEDVTHLHRIVESLVSRYVNPDSPSLR